jgi:hypothetical protein
MPHIIGSLPLLEPHGAQKMVVTIQAPHLFRKTGKRGKRGKRKVPKVLFTLQITSTTTATAITTLILKKTIIAPSDHGKFLDIVVICIYILCSTYHPHSQHSAIAICRSIATGCFDNDDSAAWNSPRSIETKCAPRDPQGLRF